jgi:hypothetical protein
MASMVASGCVCRPADPLQGGIKVYPGNTAGQDTQPTQPQPPIATPATDKPVERQITVTESNSVFSIGMPPGYTEERYVTAQKPVNFWFEYLTPDVELIVNGKRIDIPQRRTSTKLAYTTDVFGFNYVIRNLTPQAISYNLHIEPSQPGSTVPAYTREKWTPP